MSSPTPMDPNASNATLPVITCRATNQRQRTRFGSCNLYLVRDYRVVATTRNRTGVGVVGIVRMRCMLSFSLSYNNNNNTHIHTHREPDPGRGDQDAPYSNRVLEEHRHVDRVGPIYDVLPRRHARLLRLALELVPRHKAAVALEQPRHRQYAKGHGRRRRKVVCRRRKRLGLRNEKTGAPAQTRPRKGVDGHIQAASHVVKASQQVSGHDAACCNAKELWTAHPHAKHSESQEQRLEPLLRPPLRPPTTCKASASAASTAAGPVSGTPPSASVACAMAACAAAVAWAAWAEACAAAAEPWAAEPWAAAAADCAVVDAAYTAAASAAAEAGSGKPPAP